MKFQGCDVEAEPERRRDLEPFGVPRVPATIVGDRAVHGWNPKALAELVGVPYTEASLFETRTGGSPYGATHLATPWNTALSKDENDVARFLGARVTRIARTLAAART